MVLFFGGDHHQDAVRPDAFLAQGDGPVDGSFTDGDGRQFDVVIIDAAFFGSVS
jgi:hypothetical protein